MNDRRGPPLVGYFFVVIFLRLYLDRLLGFNIISLHWIRDADFDTSAPDNLRLVDIGVDTVVLGCSSVRT